VRPWSVYNKIEKDVIGNLFHPFWCVDRTFFIACEHTHLKVREEGKKSVVPMYQSEFVGVVKKDE